MGFNPKFTITKQTADALVTIESIKSEVVKLPISPTMLEKLRESARIESTYNSTKIEGNRLSRDQVELVVKTKRRFIGRERDEDEVKGYYAALGYLEGQVIQREPIISETTIQTLHALVMGKGKVGVKPTPYRDGQNIIRDDIGKIVYLPPEAQDVPTLMKNMVSWVNANTTFAAVIAGIAHYEFATIHPYYDGNGRTARLLATLILHMRGYDLKGIYSLDAYYANNLSAYYEALTIGPSHNYYEGRADADITPWVDYFCKGLAESFEKIHAQALMSAQRGDKDYASELHQLNAQQRMVLALFEGGKEVSAVEVGTVLALRPRTARNLCHKWVDEGFLIVTNLSRKARKYRLAEPYRRLLPANLA